ncbi:T9SS type A sorting domain-containing protein [Ochrovirga pacifica]|uniref:T9SS type A sorting domain-containing protein n=1 Tax=Ochrovirga pacifica TaxID=1042376 RepID=UPI0002559D64|nr:T9SS type A sorting domain-containing protein [Ochrovirga pacifica]
MIVKTSKNKLLIVAGMLSQLAFSQTNITVDPSCQRFLGEVSALDRTKYFSVHDSGFDAEQTQFRNDYDVTGGRQFWGAFARAKQLTGKVGEYPAYKNGNDQIRSVKKGIVGTHHPKDAFVDGMDIEKAGDWAVEYYKDFVNNGDLEEFIEVMNEPFVHASEFYQGGWNNDENVRIKKQMALLYNEVGKRIHSTPALQNTKVIGYSSAWPSMELNDFGHWDENMKMFMDTAGENMYAFSTHLYDGVNVTGQDNRRSGSNSEAILDLIENYSFIKWNKVKPHAITEYGAIEKGYGDDFSLVASAQTLRSINHILFNLMDREDRLVNSIPFITGKATWHITAANNYQPYQATLWIPSNIGQPNPTGWKYSPRIKFYELWKGVQGERVRIESDNPDIQTQAFLDGNRLYVAINNLSDVAEEVTLPTSFKGKTIQSIRKRDLKIYKDKELDYQDQVLAQAPASLSLIEGETVLLIYQLQGDLKYTNAVRTQKYYTTDYLQKIEANKEITYNFNGLERLGAGNVVLRMSISRKHDKSKQPIVKINGTQVTVPTNWKGYDQANRDDFFGMIEIPFSANLLKENNTISITFPDAGGRVSSLIMDVHLFDVPLQPVTVTSKSISCPESSNGEIEIQSNLSETVKVHIQGNQLDKEYTLSKNISVANLAAGSYWVTVTSSDALTVLGTYKVAIIEPTSLNVSYTIDKINQQVTLHLSGGTSYSVVLNDKVIHTKRTEVTLPLQASKNHLMVTTNQECLGMFEENIVMNSTMFLVQTVVNDMIEVYIPSATHQEKVALSLYNSLGVQLLSDTTLIKNGKLEIDSTTLPSGIFLLNVKTAREQWQAKVIKRG